MRIVRDLSALSRNVPPCALTIGNFDGVHLGHQKILSSLHYAAEARGKLSKSLMIFEPQPLEFFMRERAPSRLYRLAEKVNALNELVLDNLIVMRFNQALSQMPAEHFISDVLVKRLNVQYLLIGDDFRFGKDRQGDYEMLQQAAAEHGFECDNIDSVVESDRRVSSTSVRQHLNAGELQDAGELLGRPYRMCGRVTHGKKLGRDIGWPTINIPVRRWRSPLGGIYAVRVHGIERNVLNGVASIGTRPTVGGDGWILEVHLFDWDGDCYGKRVEVEFVQHLRNEEKFESVEVMTQQIARDAELARKVLDT